MSSTNTVNSENSNIKEALDLLFHKKTIEASLCTVSANFNTIAESNSTLGAFLTQINAD